MTDPTATLTARQKFLCECARTLIEGVGGVEAAAGFCRAGKSQLSDYQNKNKLAFIPIDVIADLEQLTDPVVTRQLASQAGYALVKLPSPQASETVWGQRIAKLMKEGGDIMCGLGKALEDNNDVDPDEAKALLTDADELVAIAVEIQSALKRRAEGLY